MSDEFVLTGVPFKTYIFLPSNGAATKVNFLLIEGSFLKKKIRMWGVERGPVLLGMTGGKLPSN